MAFVFRGKRPGRKPKPFWDYVTKADGCWLWRGAVNGGGYGSYRFNGKPRKAHHVSYILAHGYLPPSGPGHQAFVVRHACDNKLCVNPAHLALGTQLENISDRQQRNRQASGERHARAKLCSEDAVRIREASLFGATVTDLRKIYNVDHKTIRKIVAGDLWRGAHA